MENQTDGASMTISGYLPHCLNQIEDLAQQISDEAHVLRERVKNDQIDPAELRQMLEMMHRRESLELTAMIANLSYEVRLR